MVLFMEGGDSTRSTHDNAFGCAYTKHRQALPNTQAPPNAMRKRGRYAGHVLKCGVWWLRGDGMGHTGVDGERVGGRDLRGGYSSNSHINLPKTSYCISQKVYVGYG